MLLLNISINLKGSILSPIYLLNKIDDKIKVVKSNEPSDLQKNGEWNKFGFISIQHPTRIGIEYDLTDYKEWYVKFIEDNYQILINSGVEDISLFLDVFYSDQCNFEIFNNTQLKKLSLFNISLPISVYKLSLVKLRDILVKVGYKEETINHLFRHEE